ncbi:hypothetical protein Trydic_g2261 [Trypoxylus dichotomus]
MSKLREQTEAECVQVALLSSQKKSVSNIAKTMKCSRGTVRNTVQCYRGSRTYEEVDENEKRSNIGKVSIPRTNKIERTFSSKLLGCHGVTVSARTVRRRLVSAGPRPA